MIIQLNAYNVKKNGGSLDLNGRGMYNVYVQHYDGLSRLESTKKETLHDRYHCSKKENTPK